MTVMVSIRDEAVPYAGLNDYCSSARKLQVRA